MKLATVRNSEHTAGIRLDVEPAHLLWQLRKMIAIQRHAQLVGDAGSIGRWAEVTTISADGIEQRVTDFWTDDQGCIGQKIRPGCIDWDRWHRDNPEPIAFDIPAGTSRLRRDMMLRKAQKQKLRVI